MPIELYLARRYLLNRKDGAWGWLISWMATGSVAIGVAALIITLAVMTGFREDIRQKILGVQPHILVTPVGERMHLDDPALMSALQNSRSILAWAPYVMGQALVGRGPQSSGAMVKGIDPAKELTVANLTGKLTSGDWADLASEGPPGSKPAIFLGQEMARNIGARVGDSVWAMTPGGLNVPAFSMPQAHLFRVAGIVQTGLYDYDSSLAYTSLAVAQKLFGLGGQVSGFGVRVKNPENADSDARNLQISLQGAYWARSWLSLNRNLFSALKLEKVVMFTILTLVTVVASFMIVSNLLLSITQKVKEIGILRAMGATAATIHRIFLFQGLLMGLVGTASGVLLGIGISVALAQTNLIRLPADVYYIDHLPIRLDPVDILLVAAAASIIVLVATLYPAQRATQLDPLDAIRYG